MSAHASSGSAAVPAAGLVYPRQVMVGACGWGGLLTGTMAVWVAIERGTANVVGLPMLVWAFIALPPAVAGAVCLLQRRGGAAPAAVFASCSVACGYAVQLPEGHGIFLAASVFFLLCAGLTVVVSAVVMVVIISISGGVMRRRAAAWTAAGLVFVALSIPSPLYVAGGPIQTIFAGNTGSENAEPAAWCYSRCRCSSLAWLLLGWLSSWWLRGYWKQPPSR